MVSRTRRIVDGFLLIVVTLTALWMGNIYKMVNDSRQCNVIVEGTKQVMTLFGPMEGPFVGSGVLVTEDGYMITAAHCARNTKTLKVTLKNGETYDVKEYLVPDDPNLDFAIIKLPVKAKMFKPLADSNTVSGWIYNIGNAKGIYDDSFFYGTVYKNHFKRGFFGKTEFILARMTIYPGCSGGGVYKYSRLIGIAVMKPDDNGSLIVPSNIIKANWGTCKVHKVGEVKNDTNKDER